jgi:hypothetical protein
VRFGLELQLRQGGNRKGCIHPQPNSENRKIADQTRIFTVQTVFSAAWPGQGKTIGKRYYAVF